MKTLTQEEIHEIATKEVSDISGGDSVIWSEDTKYTAEELESMYYDYIVTELEASRDVPSFESFCGTLGLTQEELDASYLIRLSEIILEIPCTYGTDQCDYETLREIAGKIRSKSK